mmetsp:Transcript_46861/g.135039  ORF Transcript_46861/g.135039 Transcript_46861/m.135039 type:complete len:536 (-) Transcript_46861:183-1790(-)
MGQTSSKSDLQDVTKRLEERLGKVAVTGRYHRQPKTLESDYQLTAKVLGAGYNGQVFLAKCKSTGQSVAVKGFKLLGASREKRVELQSECEIFLAMDHPHVARLVGVYESQDMLHLVMECMTGGELFKRVVEQKRFSEKDAADVAWQMLLALNYIHTHGIVHRDIKLENFLFESPTSNHLKLIDFGFSKIWQPNTKMAASCGTLAYVAPEVLRHSYTSQCDMWSLGVTVFIVLFGYMPFYGSEQFQVRCIKEGRFTQKKDIWSKVSANGQEFVKQLLVVDPNVRLTAEAALKHPWIVERDKMQESVLDKATVDALCAFGGTSAFRKACMSMMAWSLTNDERSKVRAAFIELDVDRTGAVKLSEFKKVLESKFHLKDETIVEAFKGLDTGHNDEIHYSEFLAAMVSTRIHMHDDLLLSTFKRFDTDDSGYITLDNLKEVLGESFEGCEVAELLKEADILGDNRISYPEFIEYLRGGGADGKHQEAAARLIDAAMTKEGNKREKKMRLLSGEKATSKSGKPHGKLGEVATGCQCVVL